MGTKLIDGWTKELIDWWMNKLMNKLVNACTTEWIDRSPNKRLSNKSSEGNDNNFDKSFKRWVKCQ